MDEQPPFDVEGPVGPEEGLGRDATATTAGVLADEITEALATIERGSAPPEAAIADEKLAALARGLRDRPEVAEYVASRTAKHRDGDPPEDVDALVAALAEVGLRAVAPELSEVLDEEYRAFED